MGEGVISTIRETVRQDLPPPTTPLLAVRATRLRIGLRFGCKTTRHLSITREGEGAGQ
jgi:hypothetical protein